MMMIVVVVVMLIVMVVVVVVVVVEMMTMVMVMVLLKDKYGWCHTVSRACRSSVDDGLGWVGWRLLWVGLGPEILGWVGF